MGEWREVKLIDVVEIGSSKRIFYNDYVPYGIPFYRSKEIIEKKEGKDIANLLYISEERYFAIKNRYGSPVDGDLLLSAVGHRSGIPYVVQNDGDFYFKDGNVIWFKNFTSELNSTFLYYWILSSFGQTTLESTMIGSAQKALTIRGLKNLKIVVPTYSEQKAIAEVLSSLDDKIDLLHRQNKTLEKMAEALFRQWFVEEAEEDWEEGTLDDCLELIIDYRGKTPKKLGSDWSLSGIPAISAKNIKNGKLIRPETFKYVDSELYKKWMQDELQKGDIIMTSEAPLGELYFFNSTEKYVLSQRVFGLRTKKELSPYFIYCFLSSKEGQYLVNRRASGTTVFGIRQAELRKVEIAVPPIDVVKRFHDIVSVIYTKINNNQIQIRTLEKLRDTLLPKLMSGEVRVAVDE